MMARLGRLFVLLAVAALAAAALLAELGGLWWFADLFSHFRFFYLAGAAVALLVAILVAPRWRALLVIAGAAPHIWAISAYPVAPWTTQSDTGQRLRVASANVLYGNRRIGESIAYLQRARADIICLQEVVAERAKVIAAFAKSHPHHGPSGSRGDTLLLSRFPILHQRTELPGEFLRRRGIRPVSDGYLYHIAQLRTPPGPVTVACIHPLPPLRPARAAQHAVLFQALVIEARAARAAGRPMMIAGDFNATPYSTRLRALLNHSGLRLAGPRWTWPWTWPAGGAPAMVIRPLIGIGPGIGPGIPIDHIAVSRRFALSGYRKGPALGADHHPIIVDLVLEPTGQTKPEK